MVYMDITAQGSWGARCRVQPCSLSCTHTQLWRCWGIRRGGQMCQGKRQPTSGSARGRVRLLTPLSRPARPPSRGRAAAAGRRAAASSGWRALLSSPAAAHPAWQPRNQCVVDLGLFFGDQGVILSSTCSFVFVYMPVLKPVPPLPSHSSSNA